MVIPPRVTSEVTHTNDNSNYRSQCKKISITSTVLRNVIGISEIKFKNNSAQEMIEVK